MVNYAVLYGKTPFTLAKDINVTQEAAQEFIDAYFAGFPRVASFIDRTLEEARQTGVVKTMAGRRRLVPNLTSRNFQMRAQAEREAVNMPIQGTAADILKKAMIDLHAELPRRGLKTRMILTVHDELLFEAPREEADAAAARRPREDGERGRAQRAADGRCGRRGKLARRETVGLWPRGEGPRAVSGLRHEAEGRGREPATTHYRPRSSERTRPCSIRPTSSAFAIRAAASGSPTM